jgi:hypothetical protein
MCGSRQEWARSRLAFSVKANDRPHGTPPRLAWCMSADSSRREVGKLVRMVGGVVCRSPLLSHAPARREPRTNLSAPTRTGSAQREKSHTLTSPQTSTRLSPGEASSCRRTVGTRMSRAEAPVSRLEPHMLRSNEGHPAGNETLIAGLEEFRSCL